MANPEFFHVYKTGPLTIVGFQGKHLSEPRSVDECLDRLLALVGSDVCQLLVVDLAEVGVVSSWVLGILASVQQQGIEVHIYHAADDMQGVLKTTHLDALLDVREGLDHIE
ncbi:MAG: hypothetical protein HOL01_16065 [Planctomycetaceae bacterium]|jgi:anti-sigma B factor antagonist|nr:hypothetical protein [Planctomycetaceae bacterium]MBT6486855.1 hypothetical protein [Planctomycetaceae bacterium]MBT6496063.1 hypothetical protein [Planctomycetaceae bacterium]